MFNERIGALAYILFNFERMSINYGTIVSVSGTCKEKEGVGYNEKR